MSLARCSSPFEIVNGQSQANRCNDDAEFGLRPTAILAMASSGHQYVRLVKLRRDGIADFAADGVDELRKKQQENPSRDGRRTRRSRK
jgi:hypothetical protein